MADRRGYTAWLGAANQVAEPLFDSGGALIGLQHDGNVTPDGYCVNDVQPFYAPFQAGTPVEERMPPQLARPSVIASPTPESLGLVCRRWTTPSPATRR